MSNHDRPSNHPAHGQLGYLQLPTRDLEQSITFYREVFDWSGEAEYGSFEAPGLIGQWTTDREAAPGAGPVLWFTVDDLFPTLDLVTTHGGTVHGSPQLDQGERWLVEIDDPAGNRLGLVAMARPPRSQTMIAVADVEAASRWYRDLLGFDSDHGGSQYERLTSGGELVLQLHRRDEPHHHGVIGDPAEPVGNGVLLWFGEVSDFDAVLERVERLGATVVRPVHRNPPEGEGNGPGHREIWITDLDGYTVVVASPDGEAYEPTPAVAN